jgi:hypothetical protein
MRRAGRDRARADLSVQITRGVVRRAILSALSASSEREPRPDAAFVLTSVHYIGQTAREQRPVKFGPIYRAIGDATLTELGSGNWHACCIPLSHVGFASAARSVGI